MISLICSGSSSSPSAVEPMTSAKSTVTSLRSPSVGRDATSVAPQCEQNLASSACSVSHCGQFMSGPLTSIRLCRPSYFKRRFEFERMRPIARSGTRTVHFPPHPPAIHLVKKNRSSLNARRRRTQEGLHDHGSIHTRRSTGRIDRRGRKTSQPAVWGGGCSRRCSARCLHRPAAWYLYRHHGTVGLRQVHPHAHPGRSRPTHFRHRY